MKANKASWIGSIKLWMVTLCSAQWGYLKLFQKFLTTVSQDLWTKNPRGVSVIDARHIATAINFCSVFCFIISHSFCHRSIPKTCLGLTNCLFADLTAVTIVSPFLGALSWSEVNGVFFHCTWAKKKTFFDYAVIICMGLISVNSAVSPLRTILIKPTYIKYARCFWQFVLFCFASWSMWRGPVLTFSR